jgi:hypothetical protein
MSQLAGDVTERATEVSAHQCERRDGRNRDQSGDQRILDRGNCGVIPDKIPKQRAHSKRPSLGLAGDGVYKSKTLGKVTVLIWRLRPPPLSMGC